MRAKRQPAAAEAAPYTNHRDAQARLNAAAKKPSAAKAPVAPKAPAASASN